MLKFTFLAMAWLGTIHLHAMPPRPHVVLVMADDQGWGDMAYQGDPVLHTPHFDRAAKEGIRFDRFYAAAPVCSPTRASVLTGRHPNRMGVFSWGYPLRPQERTLAEVLKEAGYATGHFGKWHLGSVRRKSPVHPGRNGFDTWISAPNFFDNDPILSRQGEAVRYPGESSAVTVDLALSWMQEQATTPAPFLAVVWFGSPHNPHRAAETDRKRYVDEPSERQDFYGEITGMDRAFGRLRDGIRDLGLRDQTLLWYCSDNGALPQLGNAGGFRGHKAQIYEGGLLVPAFLEWPERFPTPQVISARCSTTDIYPTILDALGIKLPTDHPVLDGMSLMSLIQGEVPVRQQPMGFWSRPAPGIRTPSAAWMSELLEAQRRGGDLDPHPSSLNAGNLPNPPYPSDRFPGHAAWIEGDWKLHRIEDTNKPTRWELYNLATDHQEQTDLAASFPSMTSQLNARLETWLGSVVHDLNGSSRKLP